MTRLRIRRPGLRCVKWSRTLQCHNIPNPNSIEYVLPAHVLVDLLIQLLLILGRGRLAATATTTGGTTPTAGSPAASRGSSSAPTPRRTSASCRPDRAKHDISLSRERNGAGRKEAEWRAGSTVSFTHPRVAMAPPRIAPLPPRCACTPRIAPRPPPRATAPPPRATAPPPRATAPPRMPRIATAPRMAPRPPPRIAPRVTAPPLA
jgi:hypothetical protein